MKAIFIGADTATPEIFIVSQPLLIGKDNLLGDKPTAMENGAGRIILIIL